MGGVGERFVSVSEFNIYVKNLESRFTSLEMRISGYGAGGGAALRFTQLTDCPLSYSGQANKVLRIKSTENLVEFATLVGTTNQVAITVNANDFTFSLPQDIHLAATPQFAALRLSDDDASHYLQISWSEAETVANRALLLKVNAGSRTADLAGNLTVEANSIVNQDLTTDAVVQHAVLTLQSGAIAPYLKLIQASDTERDPVIQWLLGATPTTIFTLGVDDSDENMLKLCLEDVLGAASKGFVALTTDKKIWIGDAGATTPAINPTCWFQFYAEYDLHKDQVVPKFKIPGDVETVVILNQDVGYGASPFYTKVQLNPDPAMAPLELMNEEWVPVTCSKLSADLVDLFHLSYDAELRAFLLSEWQAP